MPKADTPKLCALKCDINQKVRAHGAKLYRNAAFPKIDPFALKTAAPVKLHVLVNERLQTMTDM